MKYVVMHETDLVLFWDAIAHREMADRLGGRDLCIAAGFIGVKEDGSLYCFGESESLGVASRPFDNMLLSVAMKASPRDESARAHNEEEEGVWVAGC